MGKDGPDNSGQNEAARLQAEIAREMWAEYKNTYQPMERKYAAEAADYDTPWRREQAAQQATADVNQAFDKQRAQSDRQMQSYGIAPDSTKFAALNQRLQIAQAGQQAAGQNTARKAIENEGWARRTGALQLGKGMPAAAGAAAGQAGAGFGAIANQQMNNQANTANAVAGGVAGGYQFGKDQGWWGAKTNPTGSYTPDIYQAPAGGTPEDPYGVGGWKDGGLVRMVDGGIVRRKHLANGGGIRRGYAGGGYASPGMAINMTSTAGGGPMVSGPTETEQVLGNLGKAQMAYRIGKGIYSAATAPPAAGAVPAGAAPAAGAVPGAVPAAGAAPAAAVPGAAPVVSGGVPAAAGAVPAADLTAAAAGTAGTVAPVVAGEVAAGTAATAAGTVAAAMTAEEAAAMAALLLLKDGGGVRGGIRNYEADGRGGGEVDGPGTSTSDSIPAALSDGEYVLNAEAVEHFGIDKLDKMNEIGLRKRYGIRR